MHTQKTVRVAAAVPDANETRDLIGLDLYAEGIQPVWLQVTNLGDTPVRAAPRSIDEEYFSPMEVAWKFRRKFSGQGRADMERWFFENQMPRRIESGETRSGFVFTHVEKGANGFNFDVYSSDRLFNLTFFVPIPGFFADYMNVDFDRLYENDEIRVLDAQGLRRMLRDCPCCSTNDSGDGVGDPFNVVIVGTPLAVRRSLLRARWRETAPDVRKEKKVEKGPSELTPVPGTVRRGLLWLPAVHPIRAQCAEVSVPPSRIKCAATGSVSRTRSSRSNDYFNGVE